MTKQKNIVKDSEELHEALVKRIFSDLNLTQDELIRDADARGYIISHSQLSKYLNHHKEIHSLTEEQLVWLCTRYGIDLTLSIGKPITATKWKVVGYVEDAALNKLRLIFPNTIIPKIKKVEA